MITTIGLEVHAQLNSKTKIFCGCEIKFAAPPNSQVCPVCLGLPGVLPVLNREVFNLGLRAVLALGGTPSQKIKFDRKNYYYPDLPKGYQISQFDCPLGKGGFVELGSGKKIRLNRAHLEEDAGKLIHDQSPDSSHVDLNRAGTPLLEIVTEPELDSPDEAYDYLTELKAILKSTGVSQCDMEKGHLRCDANVSIRTSAQEPLGVKVEIKNLNSFRAVKAALEHEILRQTETLEKKEKIFQETRLWDEGRQKTISMRSKEEAHDYRYFPEPDLVPFSVTGEEIIKARDLLPELPKKKKQRLMQEYGLPEYDANLLTQENFTCSLFVETAGKVAKNQAKDVSNWIIGSAFAYAGAHAIDLESTRLNPENLARIIGLVSEGKISLQAAKDKVFPEVIEKGTDPEIVMKEKGLEQVSDDGALEGWADEIIRDNPKVVDDFKSGKESSAMYLVGQVMRKSQGKANPGKVQEIIRKKLKS